MVKNGFGIGGMLFLLPTIKRHWFKIDYPEWTLCHCCIARNALKKLNREWMKKRKREKLDEKSGRRDEEVRTLGRNP